MGGYLKLDLCCRRDWLVCWGFRRGLTKERDRAGVEMVTFSPSVCGTNANALGGLVGRGIDKDVSDCAL